MTVKRPVSASLASAFFYIVLLSLFSTGVALITLASSLRDAEAVNIAGSLRMQSYRLGYDLARQAPELDAHRQAYARSLYSPVLQQLNRWYVPASVGRRYAQLQTGWREMDSRLAHRDVNWYQSNIERYVDNIDQFVLALQRYSERKMLLVVGISLLGALGIFALVWFTLRRIRQQVVSPLGQLRVASQNIQQGRFNYPPLNTRLENELGLLALTFDRMSGELQKLYRTLEAQVEEKTRDLHEAHRRLEVLYQCSQALNTSQIDVSCFRHILRIVHDHHAASYLELNVGNHWSIRHGEMEADLPVKMLPVTMQETTFGELRWQSAQGDDRQLLHSVAIILGRGLYFNQAQKHHQQLILMEERATIARELHDSLAQVLSYLRIQLALLKRAVPEDNAPAQAIISDFSRALNDAYRQLRELLATFRLSLSRSDLPAALKEALANLQGQTGARLQLDCRLPAALTLDAQQQINVLQIVREAVVNAIKHADATLITVSCVTDPDGDYSVYIRDNGKGIGSTEEPQGHYGLNIMRERAGRLQGRLEISSPAGGGTLVQLRFPAAPAQPAGHA